MRVLLLLLACAGCATSDDYPRRPSAQEIADVEGLYALSDGYRAHLFDVDSRLYVRIGAGTERQLMLVGPEHFASDGGEVSIWFAPPRPDDDVKRVVVAYYRKPGARPPLMFSTGPRPGRGFLD